MNNKNTNSVVPNNIKSPEKLEDFKERIVKELEDKLEDLQSKTKYSFTPPWGIDVRYGNIIEFEAPDSYNKYEILVQQCSCGEIIMNLRIWNYEEAGEGYSTWRQKLKSSDEIVDIYKDEEWVE